MGQARAGSSSVFDWLLWWRVHPSVLSYQTLNYGSLSWYKSYRGISAILLLASAALTIILALFRDLWSLVDVAIFVFLAVQILRGRRWAMIVAMVVWTLEKLGLGAEGLLGADPARAAGSVISNLLFWVTYMHAFFVAYRVEKERRSPTTAEVFS